MLVKHKTGTTMETIYRILSGLGFARFSWFLCFRWGYPDKARVYAMHVEQVDWGSSGKRAVGAWAATIRGKA